MQANARNPARGLGARILFVTAHALFESVINYGLPFAGGRFIKKEIQKMDIMCHIRADRKIVSTRITTKREILFAFAEIKTAANHCIRKKADVHGRVLRAHGCAAQMTANRVLARWSGRKRFLQGAD